MNATLLYLSLVLTGGSQDLAAGSQNAESIVIDRGALVTIKREVEVPAREAGVIQQLNVELQDEVELGDVIAHLDQDLAEIERAVAESEFRIAEKEADNVVDRKYAVKTLEVAAAALKKSEEANIEYPGTVTKTELMKLGLETDRAELSVEQADHKNGVNVLTREAKDQSRKAAQVRLDRRLVPAPLTGMVVEIYKEAGEWVDPRDSIVRIVQLNELRVNAVVDGTKYGPELRGCKVELDIVLPGGAKERFHGVVKFVNPELDPFNRELKIKADVKNHNGLLRPGMAGALTIYVGTQPST